VTELRTSAPFARIAAVVLGIVAVLQAARFLAGWPVSIGGVVVPVWASAAFALAAGLLAVLVWRESSR